MPPRSPRIEDVAREAGVSIATVSYVLNHRGGVSPETTRRVLEAVRRCNYTGSAAGRSLARGRAQTLGVVMPSATTVSDPFFSTFLSGVVQSVRQQHYTILLLDPGDDDTPGAAALTAVRSGRVEAVLLMEVEPEDPRVARLVEHEVPLVLFGRSDLPTSWVDIDNRLGGEVATAHLLELGHRRVAHIAAPQRYLYARLRLEGYLLQMRAAGLEAQIRVAEGDLTADGARHIAHGLLTGVDRPTAIFAASDVMAEGAWRAATDLGLHVPEDLSIVGFDDNPMSEEQGLSSVSQEALVTGRRVGELLLAAADRGPVVKELVEPTLRVRHSTSPPLPTYTPGTPTTDPADVVLKQGPVFAVLSRDLTIAPTADGQGLYLGDTRFLSLYLPRVDGKVLRPLTVGRSPSGAMVAAYAAPIPGGHRHLERHLALEAGTLRDRWRWRSFGGARPFTLRLEFALDFRDIFEVRGVPARERGAVTTEVDRLGQTWSYAGSDGKTRTAEVTFSQAPEDAEPGSCHWHFTAAQGELEIALTLENEALGPIRSAPAERAPRWPRIRTGSALADRVLHRAVADLDLLLTDFGHGRVPVAGLPWFATLFGRDAILASYQVLQWQPEIARSTLRTLAALQGRVDDADREEEPGKILHELHSGEMAGTGQVAFSRYYGSMDATPLFLFLFAATVERTADLSLRRDLSASADAALAFVETRGAGGATELYHFAARSRRGLSVQSWKDSDDSMAFHDGTLARPPYTLAEVQGYVHLAKTRLARVLAALGERERADLLLAQAARLRRRFHEVFWLPTRGYYAMAIDGDGRPVDALASDSGQCLWSGIVAEEAVGAVLDRLRGPGLFSGWGVRTLASDEPAFDPFSYHRGSVWPHDTSLIAAAMAQAGDAAGAARIADGLFHAADHFPGARLPELFAGTDRAVGVPVPYPSACSPQAWSAGAPLLLLTSLLGLQVNALGRRLHLDPRLPPWLPRVEVEGIPVDGGEIGFEAEGSSVVSARVPAGWEVVTGRSDDRSPARGGGSGP